MSEILFRTMHHRDLLSVKAFTDQWIGTDYFNEKEIEEILNKSKQEDLNASLLALDGSQLVGVRLTYLPGKWIAPETTGITPELWNVDVEKVGYFKSLFISQIYQNRGIGKSLSAQAIQTLKKADAQAVLCHSWLESPENSSQIYLLRSGFKAIAQHKKFWFNIDYQCTRCTPHRCECTAVEMIKTL